MSRPAPRARTTAPFRSVEIALSIEDEAWLDAGFAPGRDALETLVRRAVEAALAGAGIDPRTETEIGVTLTGDAEVRALNAEWRGKDKPTNVLSFPLAALDAGDAPGPMLGDLVLARQTLLAEAAAEDKAPADHLIHLLVHGLLHCLGYDHAETGDGERMEALEIAILSGLGIADPYALPFDDGASPDPTRS